jgi:hypothetical protein
MQVPRSLLGSGSSRAEHATAYEEGAAYGRLMGQITWGVIGVVCLVMLIRKVSR